jgi:YVTN family beta-propeller protein
MSLMFTPVKDPLQRIEFAGFSTLSPRGNGWYQVSITKYTATFAKKPHKTKNGPHTIFATVRIITLPGSEMLRSDHDLVAFVERHYSDGMIESRNRLRERGISPAKIEERLCARYDSLAEDTGVPGLEGSLFLMDRHAIICRHPENPGMLVELSYSDRVPPGMQTGLISEECEFFLYSLKFRSLAPPRLKSILPIQPEESAGYGFSVMTVAFGSIWVIDDDAKSVKRIDPKTKRVLKEISLEKKLNPHYITSGSTGVWLNADGINAVLKIDPQLNAVVKTIPVGKGPQELVTGFGSVWVTNILSNTVTRINEQSYEIEATIPVGGMPLGIAIAGGKVWVSNVKSGTLSAIEPETNRLSGCNVAVTDALHPWCTNSLRVGSRMMTIFLGIISIPLPGGKPTCMTEGAGSLWVTMLEDNAVVRVDPESKSILARIPVGVKPYGIAFAKGLIWVVNVRDNTMMAIDPETNGITGGPIPVGMGPVYVYGQGDSLWISHYQEKRIYEFDIGE